MNEPLSPNCDVCGRGPGVGVASCSFGPVSFSYCLECNRKPAEPMWVFEYLFNDVSNLGDGLAERVNEFFTWRDGAYLSWPDYRKERRAEIGLPA